MNRTSILLVATVATAGLAAPHAVAAPAKSFSKTYTTTTPMPDPTNFSPQSKYGVCAQTVPGSFHLEAVKIPGKGTLTAELTGYLGDYDLLIMDAAKEELATSGLTAVAGEPEVATVKFKKATTAYVVNCNWAGAPQSTVKYTFKGQ